MIVVLVCTIVLGLSTVAAMPTRQRRGEPFNSLDETLRIILSYSGDYPDLESKASYVMAALKEEYDDCGYLFYVFVFPETLGDDVTNPGDEYGIAVAWSLQQTGVIAKATRTVPVYIAAVMYQHHALPWHYEDGPHVEEYVRRVDEWLIACSRDMYSPGQLLDLTNIALCMIDRGRDDLSVMRALRTVLVLRCAPYAMVVNEGILRSSMKIGLRGAYSRLEEKIEAFMLPPLPPW